MVDFVNKLYFNDQKYQTNVTIRDEIYKGNLLFPMREFLSFGTDPQSMFLMSTRFLKEKIDGFCVPKLYLRYNTLFT